MPLSKELKKYFELKKYLIESNNYIYSLIKPQKLEHRSSIKEKDAKIMEILKNW